MLFNRRCAGKGAAVWRGLTRAVWKGLPVAP